MLDRLIFGNMCRRGYAPACLVLVLLLAPTSVVLGEVLPTVSSDNRFTVLVLPPAGEDEGPQLAVHWSGELPASLEAGRFDEAGQWHRIGEPTVLTEAMSLLPATDDSRDTTFRLNNADGELLASARGESEGFGWDPTLFGPGLDDRVNESTIFQGDLVVGGDFLTAGGIQVNRIARWDGAQWSAFSGPSGTGMNNSIEALTVHNGDLIAGGEFTQAGGLTVSGIARWDGTEWSGLSGPSSTGMNGWVYALTVHNGDLIAGGDFTEAGGTIAYRIARWDGARWSALSSPIGNGTNGTVLALTVHNGDLIAGGWFTQVGSLTVNRIARWDGAQWSTLSGPSGTGMNGWVYALTVHNGDLIAGGGFTQAGGLTVNRIARWDGAQWSALSGPSGTGMTNTVIALTVHNGNLIAGGAFFQAGGLTVNRIARWDGSQWSALSGPSGTGMNNIVYALTVHNGDLIAGGGFTQAGGVPTSRLARWQLEATATEIVLIDPDPGDPGEPISVLAHTQAPVNPPDGGLRGRIEADSGEFCEADTVPLSSTSVVFFCELTLSTPRPHSITAHYLGSARFLPSESAPVVLVDQFSIGGTVSGFLSSGLVLQNNVGDDLAIPADGPFTFPTELDDGTGYNVTILSQPTDPSQTCTVSNGTGTLSGADVTDVQVNCTTDQFNIGGNVSGLTGSGLVLQNNGGDDLAIPADGAFTFQTELDDSSGYNVTILSQPTDPSQTCTVSNGTGTLAGADINNVVVSCALTVDLLFEDRFEDI